MLRSRSRQAVFGGLAALATVVGTGLVAAFGAAPADAAATAKPLPAHVFAPYFEAYNGDSPAALSQQSGAKYLTMAFIQTASAGSCTPYWDGDTGTPIDASVYGDDFDTMRAAGGDVIPSFGGYTADHTGTEIADSCTDVSKIAAAFEKVITTYDVPRIDLDIEDNSLNNSAAITRRNKAIAQVESWAASNGRQIQFSYTLPTTTHGLASSGLAVLRNAVANDARVDVVNVMTFDYYDGANHEMATDTENAAAGLEGQLAGLYPDKSASQLWAMIGVTEMPGIDDYGAAETFTTADAKTVLNWAQGKGINTLTFWALQRDNGGCPGTGGSDTCSGIDQSTWYFSNTFEPFTGGSTPPPTGNTITVNDPGDQSTAVGTTVDLQIKASDSDPDASLSYSESGLPAGLSIDASTGEITGTPTGTGSSTVTVKAEDATGASGSTSFGWTVTGGSQPPGGCATAWDAGTSYVPGDQVSYQGHDYTATYYSTGAVPDAPTSWAVWQDDGSCS